MTSFKILAEKNRYALVEPIDDIRRSMGYIMILNPNKEVLKFFSNTSYGVENGREYLEYVSLSKLEKIKYWLDYKKGSKRF